MNYQKITYGWVMQIFNKEGICISQEFFAGDQVDYEIDDPNDQSKYVEIEASEMPLGGQEYYPFNMVKPEE